MRISNFVLVYLAAGFVLVIAEKDSPGNDNTKKENTPTDKQNEDPKPKKNPGNSYHRHHNQEFLFTPDERTTRFQKIPYPEIIEDEESPRQNVYLTDDTGRYHVQIQNFHQGNPNEFQTALGAISAHILNQRPNQEYIPYPPNGDPYNYPAYRGHPHATEPPVVRAYERATNPNYGVQPSADFDRFDLRRPSPNNDYQAPFPNQFDGFGPSFYNDGDFYHGLRRNSEQIQENHWRSPVDRFP